MVTTSKDLTPIPDERVIEKIFIIRERKVMLDRDLAQLYGVTTGNFNKAVKRNAKRFPEDFMFQLTKDEAKNLIFHFGRSSWGGTRKLPLAFTEQGVAMLSSVLNSERAIHVNIQIMRNFVKLRELLVTNEQLAKKLADMEKQYDSQFKQVFKIITKLMVAEANPKGGGKIGFRQDKSGKP